MSTLVHTVMNPITLDLWKGSCVRDVRVKMVARGIWWLRLETLSMPGLMLSVTWQLTACARVGSVLGPGTCDLQANKFRGTALLKQMETSRSTALPHSTCVSCEFLCRDTTTTMVELQSVSIAEGLSKWSWRESYFIFDTAVFWNESVRTKAVSSDVSR